MKKLILITMILILVTPTASADDLKQENQQLQNRVQRLEQELTEIKELIQSQGSQAAPAADLQKIQPISRAELDEILADLERKPLTTGNVFADSDIKFYGYIKLDAAYNTDRVNTGNFVTWVQPQDQNSGDNQFNISANETRFGFAITGPDNGDFQTRGNIEVDFLEGGAENKARLMMRHAFVEMNWPGQKFSILAGQTWDVIGPLNMPSINPVVGWFSGNVGYRRPQIRLTKGMSLSDNTELTLQGAITRNLGDSSTAFTPGDAGEDYGLPAVQARAALAMPLFNRPTAIGIGGHYGREELDIDAQGNNEKYNSWSVVLDWTHKLNDWLSMQGELFTGENLKAYMGGIGQGINTTDNTEIASKGGWIAATMTPVEKWRFNVGVGIDDVDTSDVETGDRTQNRSVFGNAIYSINKSTSVGFELSHWRTKYQGPGDADALRFQSSLIYRF